VLTIWSAVLYLQAAWPVMRHGVGTLPAGGEKSAQDGVAGG
jgi:hypothetical protein